MPNLAYGYHQNALICLPQDLHTLYVYWDFTPERIRTLKHFLNHLRPEMKLILRLCRHEAPLPEQELTLTTLEPGDRYFHNLDACAVYHVEFGARSPDGKVVLFSRTPVLQLQPQTREYPPTNPCPLSPVLMPEWTTPLENQPPASAYNWS